MSPVVVLRRAASLAALSLSAFLLSSCGGGGGGSTTSASAAALATTSTGVALATSDSLAGICTAEGQKDWVRSFMTETYFWWDQMPTVDPAGSATPSAYFNALLVKTLDATNLPKDRFSTTMSAAAADLMQGISAAAVPSAAPGTDPVPLTKTMTSSAGRRVGYVVFNEFKQGAQDKLVAAFQDFRAGNVQDLVLDLRYNPGGYLYIAQALGAMVAGPSIDGKVYEQLLYSNKRQFANETMYFSTAVTSPESVYPAGTPLPQLDLPRLYVLTSQLTCSASESLVNSLRGIGVQVILVGDRTCGKPYGFHRKDNCGQAYFPIEFKVANAIGTSDYTSGFPVQCRVAENPAKPLGDATEPLLAAALRHIDTGSCPPAAQVAAAGVLVEASAPSLLDRPGAPAADSPGYQPGFDGMQR